jgi:hypothetical protein
MEELAQRLLENISSEYRYREGRSKAVGILAALMILMISVNYCSDKKKNRLTYLFDWFRCYLI